MGTNHSLATLLIGDVPTFSYIDLILSKPAVFYDPRSLELDHPGGVLHAKAAVADDEAVFITSANLTEAAFDRNIEMGLLVRDRALAASVSRHFRVLIDLGLLSPLPME